MYPRVPYVMNIDETVILKSIRESFEILCNDKTSSNSNSEEDQENYFSTQTSVEELYKEREHFNFPNLDIQLDLNFQLLSSNKKWFLRFIKTDGINKNIYRELYGPYGASEIYLFLITRNKFINYRNLEFFVIDSDNECYLTPDLCLYAVTQEILDMISNRKNDYLFKRTIWGSYANEILSKLKLRTVNIETNSV
jgi:hypothetical protein